MPPITEMLVSMIVHVNALNDKKKKLNDSNNNLNLEILAQANATNAKVAHEIASTAKQGRTL